LIAGRAIIDLPSPPETLPCNHPAMNLIVGDPSLLLRTLLVGSLAYAALIVLLRLSGKRTLSKWNMFDLVVTVAFGSTLATALLSKDTSLMQGVAAFALLVALQWALTWASVRSRTVERWIKAEPRLLLYQGALLHDALRAERVTAGELRAAVRASGHTAMEDVEAIVLETDGSFSVVPQAGRSNSAMSDVGGHPAAGRAVPAASDAARR
jgi:uncharacterized membrane protein YcaP (DUF421 family)